MEAARELGRKGGRVKSAAKAAAARENGKRPKRNFIAGNRREDEAAVRITQQGEAILNRSSQT